MIYTTISEIKQRVYDDYHAEDTELNSLFFDFKVANIPEKELLEAYAELQQRGLGRCDTSALICILDDK